jgi:orotate phosphoribosyltransferase
VWLFDQLFGPAYKGITLAARRRSRWPKRGTICRSAFNRKETKDHGEGGNVIGAALRGRVLIVDDVISAGTSVRESVDLIRANDATPAGVLIAFGPDGARERGDKSGVQEVRDNYGIPRDRHRDARRLDAIRRRAAGVDRRRSGVAAYRARYGVS